MEVKRIMIDTNIYTAFKLGDGEVLRELQSVDYIGVSAMVLGELYSGFKAGSKDKQNKEELEKFLSTPRVDVVSINEETAEFYSEVYWNLRKKGKPIPTNDIWIAASAMQHGLALYSFDSHFQYIDGLLLK